MLVLLELVPVFLPVRNRAGLLKILVPLVHALTRNNLGFSPWADIVFHAPNVFDESYPAFCKKPFIVHLVQHALKVRHTPHYTGHRRLTAQPSLYLLHNFRVRNPAAVKSVYLNVAGSFCNVFLHPLAVSPGLAVFELDLAVIYIFNVLVWYGHKTVRHHHNGRVPVLNAVAAGIHQAAISVKFLVCSSAFARRKSFSLQLYIKASFLYVSIDALTISSSQ